MNENNEQYVYVMSNPSFTDLLKIGWTREHPNIRANDLNTTGIPTPFVVEHVIITQDGSKLEKQIHNHIKTYRVNTNREFFKISKEKLTEILTKELNLELIQITEINVPINTKKYYTKKINQIKELYETLEKEVYEFSDKFNKEKTELVIQKINNKKYVYIKTIQSEYNVMGFAANGFTDDEEMIYIKDTYYFTKRDIIQYKEWLDNLINNYEKIKNNIGSKTLSEDNKLFKEMILDTHKKFKNLQNEYIWEIM